MSRHFIGVLRRPKGLSKSTVDAQTYKTGSEIEQHRLTSALLCEETILRSHLSAKKAFWSRAALRRRQIKFNANCIASARARQAAMSSALVAFNLCSCLFSSAMTCVDIPCTWCSNIHSLDCKWWFDWKGVLNLKSHYKSFDRYLKQGDCTVLP